MALIKCPECGNEISDTAKSCPNCGYKARKPIDKRIIIIGCVCLVAVALILVFALGNKSSVVGTWTIDHYITDDGDIKQEDIGTYYGVNTQTANSYFSVVFKNNGKAILNMPMYEGQEQVSRECDYEVKGNDIFLSVNGDSIKAFEIKDDTLIVYGIANFDGNVALKKK